MIPVPVYYILGGLLLAEALYVVGIKYWEMTSGYGKIHWAYWKFICLLIGALITTLSYLITEITLVETEGLSRWWYYGSLVALGLFFYLNKLLADYLEG